MRETNIAGLDLNLIPALEALLRLRSVTRAAAEVGLSQPAMSRALARLRDIQHDPLLVRTPGGYILTPHALALQLPLAAAVQNLRAVFQRQTFEPGRVRRSLRLAAADPQTVLLVPGIMARLARDAPGVDLRVESYGADLLPRLESGALDLAFALTNTPLPPGVSSEWVGADRLALVMRKDHPAAAQAWVLADYGRYPSVGVAVFGDGRSETDTLLAAAGVTRRIAVSTPHFMAALAIVAATDMVTTISAALAARFAATLGLVLQEPPFAAVRLETTLICSHVRAADPLLVWFRGVVRDVASTAFASDGLTTCSPGHDPADDGRPRTP